MSGQGEIVAIRNCVHYRAFLSGGAEVWSLRFEAARTEQWRHEPAKILVRSHHRQEMVNCIDNSPKLFFGITQRR